MNTGTDYEQTLRPHLGERNRGASNVWRIKASTPKSEGETKERKMAFYKKAGL